MRQIIHVGFWKEKEDTGMYPGKKIWYHFPVENSATTNQKELIEKIRRVEKFSQKVSYLGASPCRLCDQPNGSREYTYNGFCWPEGYTHYLETHNVACHSGFATMIMNANL
jgi:hypothetical protein